MIINRANLEILYTAYNTAFRQGLIGRQATAQWTKIAMLVPSTVSEEKYGWLGKLPSLREWVGDRVVHGLEQHDYAIKNVDYELTIEVPRNAIEDDQFGVYSTMFQGIGESVAGHPDELVWPLLTNGFGDDMGLAYDGQYFFDTDHPVIQRDGSMGTVSNTSTETDGTPWYLADMRMMAKPLIFQQRKSGDDLVRRDQDNDDNVFSRNSFEYGVHCRDNAGYGWWQIVYGSRAVLDRDSYAEARAKLLEMKGDHGRPLGIVPDTLVVPPSLERAARRVVVNELTTGGDQNEWAGTAEPVVVPWLA